MSSVSSLAGKWSDFVLCLFWLPPKQRDWYCSGQSSVRSKAEQEPHKVFRSSPEVSIRSCWV